MSKILTDEEIKAMVDYYTIKLKISAKDYINVLTMPSEFARRIEADVLDNIKIHLENKFRDRCHHQPISCDHRCQDCVDSMLELGGQNER